MNTVIKKGDIIKLGKHTIMCGDSTKSEDVDKLMNNIKVDLFITDPPYNVNYKGCHKKWMNDNKKLRHSKKYKGLIENVDNGLIIKTPQKLIKNDKMSDEEYTKFLTDIIVNANNIMENGASFYIFHSSQTVYNLFKAMEYSKWKERSTLIWVKNHFRFAPKDYKTQHEPILYGWKNGKAHSWYGGANQTTILKFNKPQANKLHPTMKPIELIKFLMQNSSKINDKVLDLFLGSGTTLIACELENRICYGMEISEEYIEIIIERWNKLTNINEIIINDKPVKFHKYFNKPNVQMSLNDKKFW